MKKIINLAIIVGIFLVIVSLFVSTLSYKVGLGVISVALYTLGVISGGSRREIARNLDANTTAGKEARTSYFSIIIATILCFICVM